MTDTPNHTDARLIDLEVKLSFTEDLLDHLNQTVALQQRQIERLTRELKALRDQVQDSAAATPRSLRDELPPHY